MTSKKPQDQITARIVSYNGDVTKHWCIEVREYKDYKLYRARFSAGINAHTSAKVRMQAAKLALKYINQHISNGWRVSFAKGHYNTPTIGLQLEQCIECFAGTLRPATLGIYKQSLARLVAWLTDVGLDKCKLSDFGKNEAIQFAAWLNKQKLTNTSRNTYILQTGNLFAMALRLGMIEANPFKGVKKLREEIKQNLAFTDDQLMVLKRELSENDPGLWLYVQFIYYCFIRPNELVQLQVKDINLRTGKVYIPASVAKNRKGQYVNIPLPLLNYLHSIPWSTPGHWYLFGEGFMPAIKPVQRDAATKRHARVLKRLGIGGGCTLYSWKHTGVVKAVQSGANIKDVQNHLRHSSLEMVAKYLRSLGLEASNELASKFPAL